MSSAPAPTEALSAAGPPAGPRLRAVGPGDDEAIRALLHRRPMAGAIRLALTRDPSFAAAAEAEGERHACCVVEDGGGRLLGFGSRSVRRVYHRGRPVLVGYLAQLRADAGAFSRRFLKAGFDYLLAQRHDDEAAFDLTTIVADNRPARRLLERGLPGLPRYRPLAEIETLVVATGRWPPRALPRPRARRLEVRRLGSADLPAVVAFLGEELRSRPFAPVWSAGELRPGELCPGGATRGFSAADLWGIEEAGELVACGGIWDQRAFKQAVVEGYAPWLGALRPLVNAGLRTVGQPALPPPGSRLALAYVTALAVRGPEPERALALIEVLRRAARHRGLDQLVLSLVTGDPLLGPLRRRFAARPYRSLLYAVEAPAPGAREDLLGGELPYVEAALL